MATNHCHSPTGRTLALLTFAKNLQSDLHLGWSEFPNPRFTWTRNKMVRCVFTLARLILLASGVASASELFHCELTGLRQPGCSSSESQEVGTVATTFVRFLCWFKILGKFPLSAAVSHQKQTSMDFFSPPGVTILPPVLETNAVCTFSTSFIRVDFSSPWRSVCRCSFYWYFEHPYLNALVCFLLVFSACWNQLLQSTSVMCGDNPRQDPNGSIHGGLCWITIGINHLSLSEMIFLPKRTGSDQNILIDMFTWRSFNLICF